MVVAIFVCKILGHSKHFQIKCIGRIVTKAIEQA